MAHKFVVAFGPSQSYYFSNGSNVPQALGNLLRGDARLRPEKVQFVSLGPNSSYFIRSTEAWGRDKVSPTIENKVANLGGWDKIQWIMFTPDPDVCLILCANGQVFGHGLRQDFYDAILRFSFCGFKDICLGFDGAFALSTNNDMVNYKGMPEIFVKAWQNGDVAQVTTSTFDQFYFIEFKDGRSAYLCPKSWHRAIDEMRNAVPKTLSGSFGSPVYNVPIPPNMAYQSQQQDVGHSAVTGFISDTASDFAVQMMMGLMGNMFGN